MNILYLMIPFSMIISCFFVYGFLWSIRNEQLDDLDTPAVRILEETDK